MQSCRSERHLTDQHDRGSSSLCAFILTSLLSSQFLLGDAVTLHHGSFVEKRKNGYRDARGSLVNTHCNNQALTSVPEVENPAFFID
jgi:hypothetical protein